MTNLEELEESGTPAILGDIRVGLVMLLKEAIINYIPDREELVMKHTLRRFSKMKNVYLLGNNNLNKVAIFSFVIYADKAKNLIVHFNFVATLLNDLFGI